MLRNVLASFVFAILLIPTVLRAADSAAPVAPQSMTIGTSNRTEVTANRLMFDYKRYIATFEENVVVTDPKVCIRSDLLTLIFNRTNDVKSVTAVGNVRLQSEDKLATCNKAVYLAETGEVMMTGSAKLTRGSDSVAGDRITFYLNEDRVIVEPGRLIIMTPGGTNSPISGNKVLPDLGEKPKKPAAPAAKGTSGAGR